MSGRQMPWSAGSAKAMRGGGSRGQTVAAFAADPEAEALERDRRMLEGLVGSGELTDEEADAFADMLEKLALHPKASLTRDQRAWVEDRCDVYQVRKDAPKPVPRGREVETPEVLRNLPMKPPGRR